MFCCPLHTIALMGQTHRCQLIHLELANHPLCLTWHRCARVPLSAWYGSAVPGERAVSCGGHRRKKTAAFCINVCSRNAVITSFYDWWPGVLRRCSARLEQLAIQRHCVTDTRHLQASAEDISFHCFPYLTDLYWICAAQFFVMLTVGLCADWGCSSCFTVCTFCSDFIGLRS